MPSLRLLSPPLHWVRVARPASILDIATWAFVLAAAGLFPALFAALWWKRANAYGAAAAMLAGFAVALIYLVGTRYFAVPFFEATSALSSAGPSWSRSLRRAEGCLGGGRAGRSQGCRLGGARCPSARGRRLVGHQWACAVALLALPVGFPALVLVSLVTPRAAQRGNGAVSPRVLVSPP